jgi:regulator of ribosome biosynthesis
MLFPQRIWDCPIEPTQFGPAATLPDEVTRMPREKRIPDAKPQTRWEKFATEKGIKKKKRERMVYDDTTDQFAPRYGYKRVGSSTEEAPILEVKAGADPFADPWQAERSEKKGRVAKNLKNQINNKLKAAGKPIRRAGIAGFDPAKIPGIPVELSKKEGKRGKDGVRRALQLVQHSTASMGR